MGFAIRGESIFPANPDKGLATVQRALLIYDDADGRVFAVIDSRLVTQYKTAADSVLGALSLARTDSRHLRIAGAGFIAATLAKAYDATFPGRGRILI